MMIGSEGEHLLVVGCLLLLSLNGFEGLLGGRLLIILLLARLLKKIIQAPIDKWRLEFWLSDRNKVGRRWCTMEVLMITNEAAHG